MTDTLLCARIEELAELMAKREQLRHIYRYLKKQWSEHPNCPIWLRATERSAQIIDRRIAIGMQSLSLGVFS